MGHVHNTKIAIYGKGGIGKSTVSANLSAALANDDKKVLQIGCDPKHDSTRMLLGGASVPTVLDYIKEIPASSRKLDDILRCGYGGTRCVEAGGPQPGVGCAGRGILSTFETLAELGIDDIEFNITIYDVLGDVVCGGFAVPLRKEYADIVLIVTSGEYMSLYAANNILRGVASYDGASSRVGGIIFNGRGLVDEGRMVRTFAHEVGLPVLTSIPRSNVFAQAEAKGCTVVEGYPDSAEAALFKELAIRVESLASGLSPLYHARPLTDETMERVLLGRCHETSALPYAHPSSAQPVPATTGMGTTKRKRSRIDADRIIHGCAFAGAAAITTQVRNAVTVVHGPLSCANVALYYISCNLTRDPPDRLERVRPLQRIVSTAMDERSMVFGGTSDLEYVTKKALEKGYEAAFIITTCPSGLMGEDIYPVAKRVESSMPAKKVVVVPAGGNIHGNFSSGITLALVSAASLIDPSVPKEQGTVNIVGEKNMVANRDRNYKAIVEMLSKLDIKVNCRYISGASVQDIVGFQKGEVCLPANHDLATRETISFLSSRAQVEDFPLPFPRGFQETSVWLTALGERFGKEREATSLISACRGKYEREISALSPGLKEKKVLLASADPQINWIADLIRDLGMVMLKAGIVSTGKDILSASSPHHSYQLNYSLELLEEDIKMLHPDLVIVQPYPGVESLGTRFALIPYNPDVGIDAGISMANEWSVLMRVPAVEGWRKGAGVRP